MRTIISLALFAMIAFAGPACGSGPLTIRADEIVLKIKRMNLEVTLTRKEDRSVAVKVIRDGVEVRVPDAELAAIKKPDLESARIIVNVPHGGDLPEGFMDRAGFIISFDYEGVSEHGADKPDKSVGVFCRARLHFWKGLTELERAVPQGNFKNKWDFYSKKPGEPEIENGSEESITCPYDN
jgi:hypothetical protein